MARYIDADALIEMLNIKAKTDEEIGLYNHLALTQSFITFVERQPTADVVPKSEIAKIFEELNGKVASEISPDILPIFKNVLDFDAGFRNGKTDAFLDVLALIAELKKKYTEEK